jgi:addiction module HigA family antidote
MPMKNPPHPGGLIRRQVIEPLGLSVTEAADVLGVTRQAVSMLLNEHTSLSPEMALRIEKAFGPSMDHLMRMQVAHDIARVRQHQSKVIVYPHKSDHYVAGEWTVAGAAEETTKRWPMTSTYRGPKPTAAGGPSRSGSRSRRHELPRP